LNGSLPEALSQMKKTGKKWSHCRSIKPNRMQFADWKMRTGDPQMKAVLFGLMSLVSGLQAGNEETRIKVQQFTGKEIIPWLPAMHEHCAQCLRGFPYLYAPTSGQIINPSDTIYVNDKESLVIVAENAEGIVGIAAGLPLSSFYLAAHYFSPEAIEKFREKGYDPKNIWYMGYFLMGSKFQTDADLIHSIYNSFVEKAKTLGKTQVCYIDVIRSDAHPLRPNTYSHPEPYGHMIKGFSKTAVEIESTWPTFQVDGEIRDETHQLVFYISDL
jgi:hypothetical protein